MFFSQLSQQLQLLSELLLALEDDQYCNKIEHLCNASIGGHTRHVIELLQCVINGYQKGGVDYINRSRNLALETDRLLAFASLQEIENNFRLPDKQLSMTVEKLHDTGPSTVSTTYFRELVYNIEHTIHHLALIKVALIEMKAALLVNENFGMAYSTIKYKKSFENA